MSWDVNCTVVCRGHHELHYTYWCMSWVVNLAQSSAEAIMNCTTYWCMSWVVSFAQLSAEARFRRWSLAAISAAALSDTRLNNELILSNTIQLQDGRLL